mmetsp:Transcript_3851/g.12790  ORF Transcript_3851/g.12790 Transcript_3851/m.12790 type:complete len:209 (+) Transcript_3851:774-1400(+)
MSCRTARLATCRALASAGGCFGRPCGQATCSTCLAALCTRRRARTSTARRTSLSPPTRGRPTPTSSRRCCTACSAPPQRGAARSRASCGLDCRSAACSRPRRRRRRPTRRGEGRVAAERLAKWSLARCARCCGVRRRPPSRRRRRSSQRTFTATGSRRQPSPRRRTALRPRVARARSSASATLRTAGWCGAEALCSCSTVWATLARTT